jgi:GTP-binding protein
MSQETDPLERGRRLFASSATFVLGAVDVSQLPAANLPEVAFAGRSNVGKSSLINALTGVRGLARTSNTPGRTQELNVFDIGGALRLIDMPGYGFARAPKPRIRAWQRSIRGYLRGRRELARVFVLIDARQGVMAADREMFALLNEAAVAFQLVLTKADKLRPDELGAVAADTAMEAKRLAAALPQVIVTSSETGGGIADLRAAIADVVNRDNAPGRA